MMTFRADLHSHSTCSDGSMTPQELVEHAKERGLQGLSITDHDTVSAYEVALPIARAAGLQMISGVEFSSVMGEVSVHLLGYAFDLRNERLLEFCEKHQRRREDRNRGILNRLRQLGLSIKEEELQQFSSTHLPGGQGSIGRPHIAMAMMQHGFVSSVDEAFKKYLGNGKHAFVQGASFSAQETIDIIHGAGGFAVIAHPHLIKGKKVVRKLTELPFDGVEVYYARIPRNQEEKWLQLAKEKEWMYTGGSDFHGMAKPHIPLGCSWVPEPVFAPLYERFMENNR